MNKRLLLISPYFPPNSVVGMKRALNVVNYLPDHGWEVIVLTSPPHFSEDEYTPYDGQALDVSYGFITKWLRPVINHFKSDPGSLSPKSSLCTKRKRSYTPLDQYMWDIPGALKAGKALIRKHKPDAILVIADPWSGLMVGHRLSMWCGVPWVADLRDPWTIFEEKMALRPRLVQRCIRHLENKFFRSASQVIFNTRSSLDRYCEVYTDKVSAKFSFVRNAFDVSLFEPADDIVKDHEVFRFGYFGSFRKFVSPENLLRGFALFVRKYGHSSQNVRLSLTGNPNPEFMYYVHELKLQAYCEIQSPVEYSQTMRVLKSCDSLLLVVSEYYRWMVPAKLYDYLSARKPILALSENEEVNTIIEETNSGVICRPGGIESIADKLEELYRSRISYLDNQNLLEPYSVTVQVKKIDAILSKALGKIEADTMSA